MRARPHVDQRGLRSPTSPWCHLLVGVVRPAAKRRTRSLCMHGRCHSRTLSARGPRQRREVRRGWMEAARRSSFIPSPLPTTARDDAPAWPSQQPGAAQTHNSDDLQQHCGPDASFSCCGIGAVGGGVVLCCGAVAGSSVPRQRHLQPLPGLVATTPLPSPSWMATAAPSPCKSDLAWVAATRLLLPTSEVACDDGGWGAATPCIYRIS